jgi:alkanesulfonate monooxygenase SsuD/methylene tetrahydromethanopterin reductase-like flavin-dependent oxidoreductase (luciferase family)
MAFEIGVFDHLDRGGFAIPELYQNRLRAIERYDEHGFYAYHLAEHHGTEVGMAPSPGLFLASAAQRTTRLRLGAMVYVLPAHNPLRLIEEICMLDNLSGGRIEVGLGRGASPYELAYFDVTSMQSRAIYSEACAVLLAGLGSPVLNFSGKHFFYDGVAMVLQPVQLPHPPLWHGLVRANSVAWPVSLRMNVVVNGASRYIRTLTDAYKAEWRKQHGDDALPKMGISRHIVVADTDAAASDAASEGYASWYASNDSLWRANGARGIYFPATFEEAVALRTVIAGNPETVLRALTTEVEECGANYLIGRFTFGSMPIDRVIRSIDLFGTEVAPGLRKNLLPEAVA